MKNKNLLNEIARFQSIAGLRTVASLKEDMYDEDTDAMGADTIEDEPINELDAETMEVMKQIGTLVGMTGGVMGAGKLLLMYAKSKLKKENPEMSEEELNRRAKAELQAGMQSSMGQTKGTGIGGGAAS